jgi:hypothetical protein
VTVPLPVPEAELSVSQAAFSLAVQVRVPPPVLLMVRVWAAGLPPPCWAVNVKAVGLTPIAGEGVGDGVGVGDAGVRIWLIPGISESRRPNALEPLALAESPDPTAASPVLPDVAMAEVAESDDDPTACTEVEEADDDIAAKLLGCTVLVVDWTPDDDIVVAGWAVVVSGVVVLTGELSDNDVEDVLVEGVTVAILGRGDLRMRLCDLWPWGWVVVERRLPEIVRFSLPACGFDGGIVVCARADDVK